MGWNWWQCELWCPSSKKPSPKKKHASCKSSAPTISQTTFTSSPWQSHSCAKVAIGWCCGWQSWWPCSIVASYNRGPVYCRSYAGALQRYKCRARWGNCKGLYGIRFMYLIENNTVLGCAGVFEFSTWYLASECSKNLIHISTREHVAIHLWCWVEQVRCELLIDNLVILWLFSVLVDNPIALQFVQ